MMNFPQMIVPMFLNHSPRQLRYSTAALNGLLFGLMITDVAWLTSYPKTPSLYEMGRRGELRYQQEAPGKERWLGLPAIVVRGVADCEDLATGRAAEIGLKTGFVPTNNVLVPFLPAAKNIWRLVGNTIRAHAFVELADGSTEDPSEVLGMRSIGFHRPGRPWPGRKVPSGLHREARGI